MQSRQVPRWARRTDRRWTHRLHEQYNDRAIVPKARRTLCTHSISCFIHVALPVHRVKMAMAFNMTEGVTWMYGPHYLPDGASYDMITPSQHSILESRYGLIAFIRHYDKPGIWAGPTCTRQCRHALARTRSIPPDRHTPSDRQVPFARRGTSRLTRYTMSDRRGLTRQESYLHGRCSGEAPGHLRDGC